jgi:hypothetical protein
MYWRLKEETAQWSKTSQRGVSLSSAAHLLSERHDCTFKITHFYIIKKTSTY